jgi:hypothetical protein
MRISSTTSCPNPWRAPCPGQKLDVQKPDVDFRSALHPSPLGAAMILVLGESNRANHSSASSPASAVSAPSGNATGSSIGSSDERSLGSSSRSAAGDPGTRATSTNSPGSWCARGCLAKRIWQPARRGAQSGGPFRHHRVALQPRSRMSGAACTSRAATEGTPRARRPRPAVLLARWRG